MLRLLPPGVKHLDRRGLQQRLIAREQRLRRDGGNVLGVAQTRHAVGLARAHRLQHLRHGVAALVVEARLDRVDEVLLLALNIAGAEAAVFQIRLVKRLRRQLEHRRKDGLAVGDKGVLDKIGVKADEARLALAAHERAERRAIEVIETVGDGGDVGVTRRAVQQDAGQQRVDGRRLAAVRLEQVDAEAAGFETVGADRAQGDPRLDRNRDHHGLHPFIASIIHDFSENKRGKRARTAHFLCAA